jgi:hypothetical protein
VAKNTPEEKGKVKFRFVEFELEGLNSTIEESIKSIVNSMNRVPNSPMRMATAKPALQISSAVRESGNGHADVEPPLEELAEVEETPAQGTRSAQPKGQRHYTNPKFLSEVDLDSGAMAFKTFAEKQAPRSDNRKYLVIAAWFKKNRNLDVITPNHIYTCNQKMGWTTQKDVSQPFRYMKKKSYFAVAGRNQWQLTHVGLDQLNKAEEAQ